MSRFEPSRELRPIPQPGPARPPDDPERPPRFFSLHWKIVAPLFVVVLVASMFGAYVVADSLARGADDSEVARLQRAAQAVQDRAGDLAALHQREVLRVAYTGSVPIALDARDTAALNRLLEPLAVAASLDYVIVTDPQGQEVLGLQRALAPQDATGYAAATGTDLSALAPVRAALSSGEVSSGWIVSGGEHVLVTAGPVVQGGEIAGVVLVGTRSAGVLDALRGGDGIELALFGEDGAFWDVTLAVDQATREELVLPASTFARVLRVPDLVPVARLDVNGEPYRVTYVPLMANGAPVGVVGVYAADSALGITRMSRPLLGVVSALLAALVVVVAFALMSRVTLRLGHIAQTAETFAAGNIYARTGMAATDEVGALGASFDRLADRVQRRTETLEQQLRAERREAARLTAILEAIPDGIVVQDLEGRVIMMNDAARKLLGGQRSYRAARLHELASVVVHTLGPALAPGIYALGDPAHIPLDGRMLHAQAAAIMTRKKERIGTVIVVRDVTEQIALEQVRDGLIDRLEDEVRVPGPPQSYDSLAALAREVAHNTHSLQRVIAELRDLSTYEPRDLRAGQRPLEIDGLLRQVEAEWEPHVKTANLRLKVAYSGRGWYVLGDERRVRWAIGNVIDNAIKYSPPGALITLSARLKESDPGRAEIVVEDTGHGMTPQDLAKAFTRFFRGTPRDAEGRPVRRPGTGQGLFIARRVIEAHGGQIALASRDGAGTTAVITLPLTSPVTLELREDAARPGEKSVRLSSGPYDTVPLEPRPPESPEHK